VPYLLRPCRLHRQKITASGRFARSLLHYLLSSAVYCSGKGCFFTVISTTTTRRRLNASRNSRLVRAPYHYAGCAGTGGPRLRAFYTPQTAVRTGTRLPATPFTTGGRRCFRSSARLRLSHYSGAAFMLCRGQNYTCRRACLRLAAPGIAKTASDWDVPGSWAALCLLRWREAARQCLFTDILLPTPLLLTRQAASPLLADGMRTAVQHLRRH